MFIIKFNNMVKNKWIWAAFAIVVAVAFGASDMLGAGGADASARSAARRSTPGSTRPWAT